MPFIPFLTVTSAFPAIWQNIKESIAQGGLFAGTFFGTSYKRFTENEKKFLEKEMIQQLFQNFKIVAWEKKEGDHTSGTGRNSF